MTKDSQPDNKKARMEKCNGQTPITEEGQTIIPMQNTSQLRMRDLKVKNSIDLAILDRNKS